MADAPEAAGAPAAAELPEDVSSLLDEITVATGIKDREAKRIARRGVQELLANLVSAPVEKIDKALIDESVPGKVPPQRRSLEGLSKARRSKPARRARKRPESPSLARRPQVRRLPARRRPRQRRNAGSSLLQLACTS